MNRGKESACRPEDEQPLRSFAFWVMLIGAIGSLLPWTPPWLALLAGTALAITLGSPCRRATGELSRSLLQVSVVGLGAGVNLSVVFQVGLQGFGYTALGLLATFVVGYALAKWLGLGARMSALICSGTGICGGSAIAAVAPMIEANVAEITASLATVFLLNGAALLIFPPLGDWAGLDSHAFGLWCALAIHDTSSVTGAAMTHGADSLSVATTVKLARALWIVPVALALGWYFALRVPSRANAVRRKVKVPWFIAGFVAISAVFTFIPQISGVAPWILTAARSGLTLTLFLIGMGLDRATLKCVGVKPFLHGLLLWIVAAGGTLAAIKLGWVH